MAFYVRYINERGQTILVESRNAPDLETIGKMVSAENVPRGTVRILIDIAV